MINNIAHLFLQYKAFIPKDAKLKQECQKIIYTHTGITIDQKSIRVQENIFWVSAPSVVRHEIERNKQAIHTAMNTGVGARNQISARSIKFC
jgi:hypothetical protein